MRSMRCSWSLLCHGFIGENLFAIHAGFAEKCGHNGMMNDDIFKDIRELLLLGLGVDNRKILKFMKCLHINIIHLLKMWIATNNEGELMI